MATRKNRSNKRHSNNEAEPIDCNSPTVHRRLSRISDHYDQLRDLLADLESRIPAEPSDESTDPRKPR